MRSDMAATVDLVRIFLTVIFCFSFTTVQLVMSECPEGKYGVDCRYDCHCGSGITCDPTSGCNPTNCSSGWSGATCQKENVALNGSAVQSSTAIFGNKPCPAEYAVDGKVGHKLFTTPCTHTNATRQPAYWSVTLSQAYGIFGFTIYNREDYKLCSSGTWGSDCGQYCHCWNDVHCSVKTGACPVNNRGPTCKEGYHGAQCNTVCPDGQHGPDCSDTCGSCAQPSTSCNKRTGECPFTSAGARCLPGYLGTTCKTAITGDTSGSRVGGIVGGAVGALLAVACVTIIVVLFVRRRFQTSRTENIQTDFDGKLENLETSSDVGGISDVTDTQNNVYNSPYEELGDLETSLDVDGISSEIKTQDNVDNSPYENTAHATIMVSIDTFRSYLAEKISTKELITEFESLKDGLCHKHNAADRQENQGKSRYKSLLPYDHSRVILNTMPGSASTDYINASYINGYNEPKKYIASQGPTKVMINDFMLMIWEQEVGKVVMVTNLVENTKQKCLQYWPDDESSQFGVIKVSLAHVQVYSDFIIRTLQLTSSVEKDKTKVIKQFHFTSWPDHGAPANVTGLLDFRDKVNGYSTPLKGPTVVHCSAGIGRTGTYIALDYLIDQADSSGKVDVLLCVNLLREQRVNMVQTQEQYDFLYQALSEGLQLSYRCIPCVDFSTAYEDLCSKDTRARERKLSAQFRILGELTPDLTETSVASAKHPDNQAKNRFPDILAADTSRPFLATYVHGSNNYINAVFLPSYKMKRAFLITQMPLPNTVVDFWRLVYEQSVSAIVMLNREDNTAKNNGIYWPDKSGQFGPFNVEEVTATDYEDFSVVEYEFSYKKEKINVPVKQFRCKFWPQKCPKSATALLTFIQHVEQWRKESGNKPVIVHCRDGVSRSGVYCAASAIMERIVEDKDVNIVQMVKQLRIHRPQIITDLEQFDFLHRVVIEYLKDFQTYSNFM